GCSAPRADGGACKWGAPLVMAGRGDSSFQPRWLMLSRATNEALTRQRSWRNPALDPSAPTRRREVDRFSEPVVCPVYYAAKDFAQSRRDSCVAESGIVSVP
ncbi:MAG: hypothetical protein ABI137_13570, partial [Antricoccus sp.]